MNVRSIFKFVLLLTVIAVSRQAEAQQLIQSNLYNVNHFWYNPANAGDHDAFVAYLSHRKQWLDFPGAPVTSALSVHTPVGKHVGFGGTILSDRTDIFSRIRGSLSYAYYIKLAKEHTLSLGVSAGVTQHKLDLGDVNVPDPSDVVLATDYYNGTTLFADFGLTYKWKGLRIGAAAPDLFEASIDFEKLSDEYFEIERQYIFFGGYDIKLLDKKLTITPSGMYRYFLNGVSQFDANLHLDWKDKVWIGGTYRQDAGYVGAVGFKIADQVTLGYAYEFSTSGIAASSTGSHEAILGFTFGGGNREKDEEQDKKLEELTNAQNDIVDQLDSLSKTVKSDREATDKNTARIDSMENVLKEAEAQLAEVGEQMLDFSNELADQSKRIDAKLDTGMIKEYLTRLQLTQDASTGETKVEEVALERGYYVVIESFRSQDNALRYIKGFNDRAERAIIVHNKSRGWYYCYLKKYDNLQEALVAMKKIREQGFDDAWVHIYKPK